MTTTYKTIAESNNFIVLDKYTKFSEVKDAPVGYQSEADLEREFVKDLTNQGYDHLRKVNTQGACLPM